MLQPKKRSRARAPEDTTGWEPVIFHIHRRSRDPCDEHLPKAMQPKTRARTNKTAEQGRSGAHRFSSIRIRRHRFARPPQLCIVPSLLPVSTHHRVECSRHMTQNVTTRLRDCAANITQYPRKHQMPAWSLYDYGSPYTYTKAKNETLQGFVSFYSAPTL